MRATVEGKHEEELTLTMQSVSDTPERDQVPSEVLYAECDSPIGPLQLASDGRAITALYMNPQRHAPPDRHRWRAVSAESVPVLRDGLRQLAEYFEGARRAFTLPLALVGTVMQQRVWMALRDIPFGETVSYGTIARRIGHPAASRAVGAANGRNPIAIIVPCHRVIGADGSLTGFGGGLDRKRWLLTHEARVRGTAGEGDAAWGDLFSVR
jgi:methylated-DNA-[protein]-cysteine S-methyltransferase